MTRYHSRKFILSAAIVLINSVFVACGVITPQIYQNIIGWTITAYIAGNVWQKKGEV